MENTDKEKEFLSLIERNRGLISRVCYMYSSDKETFSDMYQETLLNLWQGIGRFRGDSNISTWIYRVTLNSCISYFRQNHRHDHTQSIDSLYEFAEEVSTRNADVKEMYEMISRLKKLDRAIILLWLDEKSYEEIAVITGLSHNNVAVKLHRIKEKMSKMSETY